MNQGRWTNLFFCVSTALIIRAPLVPGSLTYSNFGGGVWGVPGLWTLPRFESASKYFIVSVGARSPFREPNALLKNRGRMRVREEGRGKGGVGTDGIISEIDGWPPADVEGRRGGDVSAVEGRD